MSSFETACLHIFHGGLFNRVPHIRYIELEASEVYINPNYLSVHDIEDNVVNLGYSEDMIKSYILVGPMFLLKKV